MKEPNPYVSQLKKALVEELQRAEPPTKCGKSAGMFIPRWGMFFPCVLDKDHEGECRPGGNCAKHGDYIGEPNMPPQCPKWPDCIEAGSRPSATAPKCTCVVAHCRQCEQAAERGEYVTDGCGVTHGRAPTPSGEPHKYTLDEIRNDPANMLYGISLPELQKIIHEYRSKRESSPVDLQDAARKWLLKTHGGYIERDVNLLAAFAAAVREGR